MDFYEAKEILVPFKKYKGQTLDQVASTDAGLLYLDWLRGKSWLHGTFKIALEVYMDDWTIRKELDRVLEERRR